MVHFHDQLSLHFALSSLKFVVPVGLGRAGFLGGAVVPFSRPAVPPLHFILAKLCRPCCTAAGVPDEKCVLPVVSLRGYPGFMPPAWGREVLDGWPSSNSNVVIAEQSKGSPSSGSNAASAGVSSRPGQGSGQGGQLRDGHLRRRFGSAAAAEPPGWGGVTELTSRKSEKSTLIRYLPSAVQHRGEPIAC